MPPDCGTMVTAMNDGYEEILVKRQPKTTDVLLKGLVIALALALCAL